jgi:hypothetical protein
MPGPISNGDKWKEARREIGWRKYVYPHRIEMGKMQADHAQRLIEIMEAIAEDYRILAEQDDQEERLL